MDWDKLRIFKAVAEAGSFTNATDTLNLSQSAISRQISGLEASLGLKLFYRHARGLILTEQGEMLFQTSSDIFKQLHIVETQLADSRALPTGPLTITTLEFIASTWLAPIISDFKEEYPDIQLTMLLGNRIYDLEMREADIALRLHKDETSNLIERHILTIDFVLCASKIYIEKNGCPKTIEDFKNHTMIGYPPNIQTPFPNPNWIFKRLNINLENNPNVILINALHARYAAMKNGAGISILPHYIVAHDNEMEVLLPEIEIPSVDMYFAYPQARRNSKRIAVFKDFLMKYIEKTKQNDEQKYTSASS